MVTTNKPKKSIIDYIFTVGSRGLNRLFALLIAVLIARSLGVENFAIYSLFFGVFILVFQAQAGLNIAYVRYAKTNTGNEAYLLRLSLYFQMALLTIFILAGWPLAYILSNILEIEDMNTIYLGIISSGFLGLYGIWFGYFQAKSQFIYLGCLTLLFNLFVFVLIGGTYIFEYSMDLNKIFSTYLLLSILLGTASLLFLWIRSKKSTDKQLAVDFYKMVGLNLSVTLLYFVYRYIDVYFIKYYSDLETVGIYSAAMKTSMLLNILTGALPTILLPKAVSAIKTQSALNSYLKKSYILVAAIIACFTIFLFLAPLLLEILFGAEYVAASFALQILVVGWMFNTAYIPIAQVFYALNKVKWRLAIELLKLVTTVVAFILLIPIYGANGAAFALLIAIIIALFFAMIVCHRLTTKHFEHRLNTE